MTNPILNKYPCGCEVHQGDKHDAYIRPCAMHNAAPRLLAVCQRIYSSFGETTGEVDGNMVQTVQLMVSYEVMAQLAAAIAKATNKELGS